MQASKWTLNSVVTLSGIVLLSSACVPLSEHNKLKQQFDKQEQYVQRHRDDVRQASRETTRLAMQLREKELEIQKLQAEKKDLSFKMGRQSKQLAATKAKQASLAKRPSAERPTATKTQAVSAPRPQVKKPAITPSVQGFKINGKTQGIILDQSNMFAPGSFRLKSSGKSSLRRLATTFKSSEYRHANIKIEGHTDSTPIRRSKTIRDNWQLAGMRARAVLNYLEKCGVSSDRLSFAGYSYHKPLTRDSSKRGQARNRRVEIVLTEK